MKTRFFKYIGLGSLMALFSCSQEELSVIPENGADGNVITFTASFPDGATRGQEITALDSLQATAFYTQDLTTVTPYFENEKFRQQTGRIFSPARKINCIWPETTKGGDMEFLAFYPPINFMKECCRQEFPLVSTPVTPADPEEDEEQTPQFSVSDPLDNYFRTVNTSSVAGNQFKVGYSIDRFRVARNIGRQVDFLTARNAAPVPAKDAETVVPVSLKFQHELSCVDIRATVGSNNLQSFEVVGIRIGNPVVEADFDYSAQSAVADNPGSIGRWDLTSARKESVEYIFKPGDKTILMGEATSIMQGGEAMLIPATVAKWVRKYPEPETQKVDQMYFSLLVRVTKKTNASKVIYPYPSDLYPEDTHKMEVVLLAVNPSGEILARVYRNDKGATFSDEGLTVPYTLPAGVSVKEFGWAAVPVGVAWEAGKRYRYTLDYSNGIGYHDPQDPEPGRPIEEQKYNSEIKVSVEVEDWTDAEGYNPDVTVPME